MIQQHAGLTIDIDGINKALSEHYLEWYDEQMAVTIPKPVDKLLVGVLSSNNFELSQFLEQLILKLILHKKFTDHEHIEIESHKENESSHEEPQSIQKSKLTMSPEKVGFSKLESEFVMSIPKANTVEHGNISSLGSGLVDLGVQNRSHKDSSYNMTEQVVQVLTIS
jgi:hypothetical protein